MTNIKEITDVVVTIGSIAIVVIAALYVRFNKQIKEKEAHGSLVAKSLDVIGSFCATNVYQAQTTDKSGDEKKQMVVDGVNEVLDTLKLPNPGKAYINGEVEKAYNIMKQGQADHANQVVNVIDKVTKAGVAEAATTELPNDTKKRYVTQATTDVLTQLGLNPDQALVNTLVSGAIESNVANLPDTSAKPTTDENTEPVEPTVKVDEDGVGDLTKEG